MTINSYKELTVWQKSFRFSLNIYRITKNFPKDEIYALTSQMRRAAVSIPSNIAEGFARKRKLEYIQFLQIAYASGAEVETQILIARELNYISDIECKKLIADLEEITKMLNSLVAKIRSWA